MDLDVLCFLTKLLFCVCTADSIEANIEASAVDVAYATEHLQQAHRHQVTCDLILNVGCNTRQDSIRSLSKYSGIVVGMNIT